ncbi:30S ribosomal protein S9 [Candidatus Pacearchaeota archaeon]|nr:30S ribosomal protein S9 [Candidatus Pacearchaeota archaeon]
MADILLSRIMTGKRKEAVAKIRMKAGKGEVYYKGLPANELPLFHKLALAEPLRIFQHELGEDLRYDFYIRASGGGKEAQIQAARLALAKALIEITGSETLKKAFIAYDRNMVVPDARRKEASKPGDSAPRAKRQKSYR